MSTARRSTRRSRRPACCSWCSACCCRRASLRAELHETMVQLRAPLRTANGELRDRSLLLLEVDEGWGEAAPLEPYDGVTVDRCRAALASYLPILRDADPSVPGVRLVDACRAADPLPQALAGGGPAAWGRGGTGARPPGARR